jgi:DNA-binding response OmpR family regulator
MHERILLVEDDRDIVDYLGSLLLEEGFVVESVSGQKEAVSLIEEKEYDCLLIDISLSDGNGYAVCSAARQKSGSSKNTSAAVIFLTASGDEYSIVTGLDMGADDYIQKPFRPRELVSRIRSVLRRTGKSNKLLKAGSITIDTVKGTVYKNGEELFLSALEYRLLLIFFNNKGAVLSRGLLLQEMWDIAGEFVNDNTLTVYIKRLREKIEDDPSNPTIIKTVRGMGYRV